ncbi:30S ribosomal protein S6 [Sulfurospirillum diekertiae]|uniref:Small ribosomal subunit protein bS6 n=1 Tax=Sulfurospirillum diekertiae TaxID=1854492 RepID=A0A290HTW9_9BACT|nr:30S ribosomal protein S6 [Sulfurospirillum diekertiae]ASC93200.1 30S ribosomal protein S6 [Sulfurospirillum diekertiae]ATB69266.1 SSU ribosomal protein S6p [Sulfurospirillum diekertiae]QIR76911.1 30S ribosomal protein S6 [Sulfurospirillum diekertiae]QIR79529.1 30S ribosomal protein S6 [Sulfurospirillum diekertiae]
MRHYELLVVVKPTLTVEELQAKLSFLKEILEKNGAVIAATLEMGTRKLAYQIDKFERGSYVVFYFTAPTPAIAEVERLIRITEEFIRFMTVKFENQKELRFWNKQVDKITKKSDAPAAPVVESKEIVEDTVTTEA